MDFSDAVRNFTPLATAAAPRGNRPERRLTGTPARDKYVVFVVIWAGRLARHVK
jgi:hypothetical protein